MRAMLVILVAVALVNNAVAAVTPLPPGGNSPPISLDPKVLEQISDQVSEKVRTKLMQDLTALKPDVTPKDLDDIKVTPGDCNAVRLELEVQKRTNAKMQKMWEDDIDELNREIAALKDDLGKQKALADEHAKEIAKLKDLVVQRDREVADLKKTGAK